MGIRVEANYDDKNMNEKIKGFKLMKDPYIIVVGDKEKEERTVSITVRGQKQQMHGVSLDTFYKMVKKLQDTKAGELIKDISEI